MTGYLVTIALVLVGLKLLVWWCEPRIAFYPIRGVQETPAALKLPFTDVRIPTGDGETLRTWWLEAPSPGAQVVFFHGNGGNLSLWLGAIAGIRQRGLSVPAVDYRGYGDSTGRPSERGTVSRRRGVDPWLRTGSGRAAPRCSTGDGPSGAPVAAHAATRLAPDALVLECPMSNARSLLRTNPVLWLLSFFSSYLRNLGVGAAARHSAAGGAWRHGLDRAMRQRRTVFEQRPREQDIRHDSRHRSQRLARHEQLYWQAIDTFIARVRPGSR